MNIAEINASALKSNVEYIRSIIDNNVKICAVVKANAYGHNAPKISSIIHPLVDCFAVSLIEEAVELRLSGVDKQILLLLPTDKEGLKRAIEYNVTPSVTDFDDVATIMELDRPKPFRVHVKVNTGMNRFGFSIKEIDKLCDILKKNRIEVEGCYSHFYNAISDNDCDMQLIKFNQAKKIVSKYYPKSIYHISASGGILKGKKYNLDMVRPGLLLYGYFPFGKQDGVFPVMTIKGKSLKTRDVKTGENLLYGKYEMRNSTCVSIVRGGYADGLNRSLGNIINNRCMDVCAIPYCKDDMVTIFNDAEQFARQYNGITYEVLCKATIRAHVIIKD